MEKLAVIELTETGTRLTIANESNGKYKANNIYMAARGDNESSYGYRWRYVEHT